MLFRRQPVEPIGPTRPSHWHEDPNQRTDLNESTLDYPDTDTEPDTPEDYGLPHPETAVPVYLVEAPPNDRTLRDWAGGTYTVDTVNSQQVGGSADRGRRRLVVRNLDAANAVFLLRASTDSNFTGYKLPAGQEIELFHNHSVWLRAETADVEVTTFVEFDVDDLN